MPSTLVITLRLIARTFHGRRDGGEPEWPPSPLRAFQALTAAACASSREMTALAWLESLPPPIIIAPNGIQGLPFRTAVPNNDMDIVAADWAKGVEPRRKPSDLKSLKTVRPTHLRDGEAVHYLWALPKTVLHDARRHATSLTRIARDVVALGWGIDLAVGDGAVVEGDATAALAGECWKPCGQASKGLRVAIPGTLAAIRSRHDHFLGRLDGGIYTPPPPLQAFSTISYRRSTDPPLRDLVVFSLLRPDAAGFKAFDPSRKGMAVVGMMRHAMKMAATRAGWDDDRINAIILGHGESRGERHAPVRQGRFAILPLPSLEARGDAGSVVVGAIRRVMVACLDGDGGPEIRWAARAFSGETLIPEGLQEAIAFLSVVPSSDRKIQGYLRSGAEWATVTPVVLPGFDDPAGLRRRLANLGECKRTPNDEESKSDEQHRLLSRLERRIERLLRTAIVQAGFSEILARHAEVAWRHVGWWAGLEPAERFGVPRHLQRFTRVHVRIGWRDPEGRPLQIPGPICIGAGRYYGAGLFAVSSE